ncbi:MAG: hypothetical protein P0S93_03560 [Candidatus Neptunochlamydia sp.]|nr:hypothetical protein [Candidatus Neptunochlamydia sp.]
MIIDDTIEENPYTDALENEIICCHFSHECITADVSLPVSIETADKELIFYDVKTKEEIINNKKRAV